MCQICEKPNHTAIECWYRFEDDYQPEERVASTAVTSYGIDTNWYTDTGATDHVTGELEKLTTREKYHGRDQVHTTNGAGMKISHIGNAIVHTPTHDLKHYNVLHVPSACKTLYLCIN